MGLIRRLVVFLMESVVKGNIDFELVGDEEEVS